MSDRTNDRGGGGKGRPPGKGGARGGAGKTFGARGGDRPARGRGGDERPSRGPRREGDEPRAKRFGGDRPARSERPRRDEGDRPFRGKRPTGERESFGEGRSRREDRTRTRPKAAAAGEKVAKPRTEFSERIAKVIARAGLCSRRDAEAWIEAGRVEVNGVTLTSPALDVSSKDKILVDGAPLPSRERTRLFMYHKPRGVVTTARDPEGRTTVFEALPPGLPRVVTIGRLDINTEGLLLLTNDGGLARVLELPETGWLRRYRVRAFGEITQPQLDALRDGVTVEGIHYGPVEATLDRSQGDNAWLTLGLREGKNREVKKILEHLGLQVNRLIRLSFGPFQLGDLPEGAAEEITTRVLQDQLGPELAAQAEADFDAPVFVYDEDDFRPTAKIIRGAGVSGDDRPRRRGRDEPPAWGEDRDERRGRGRAEAEEEAPRPKRRHPMEPLTSIWRAEDAEAQAPKGKIPRRGADPKLARQESADKPRERVGKVTDPKGRAVKVERIKAAPELAERAPEGERRPRRAAADRPMRDRGDRPVRDRAERSERPARAGGERPFRGRTEGERGEGRGFGGKGRGERPAGGKRFESRGPRDDGGGGEGKPKQNLWFESRRAEGEGGARKPRSFKPREDRGEGFKPRGERAAGGFKGRADRAEGGFKPRGGKPGGGRGGPGGSRPGGSRPGGGGRPPRRPREG
ncbi:pseudouridine synthase [Alsobacter soli]|uniref:pseudouridine synthase n=1 Tax=Alsobacter soli TaxID=2109933 RepID=UPI001FE037BE|nr:pseudouridine synthase [Alsobacter soli]